MSSWDERNTKSSWLMSERPVTVAIAAPKDCGKTAYLAALRHLGEQATVVVDGASYGVTPLAGHGPSEVAKRQAAEEMESIYWGIKRGELSEATQGWHCYHTTAERRFKGEISRRELVLFDALGGHLFPGVDEIDQAPADSIDGEPPNLANRLEELGLRDAEHVLMVFVNEPDPHEGRFRIRHHMPAALANYVEGVRFERVILYVACSDALFPRIRDIRPLLDRYNREFASTEALRHYASHFSGSPHYDFTLDLIQFLAHAGAIGTSGEEVGGDVGLFWGSAFGVERYTGRPNVVMDGGPSRLSDASDWIPVHVLEPLLWCAGLLSQG